MRTYFPLWLATLAVSASLTLEANSPGRAWSDAGYNRTSSPNDCWYSPQPLASRNPAFFFGKNLGFSAFAGVENFRGLPDADGGDNNGVNIGFELAAPVPYLKEYGLGFQFGASYGAYDFAGRGYSHHIRAIQSQSFLTVGLFSRPQSCFPVSMGIAYDWMFNENYGIHAENPTIEQFRGQISYLPFSSDEIGIWASYDVRKTHKVDVYRSFDYQVSYRAISQANFFWKHNFACGAESTVWAGFPFKKRLDRSHSNYPGKYIVGLQLAVPFLDDWELIGRACYMQPGTRSGPLGNREYTSNIAINVVYHLGGNSTSCKQECEAPWRPYLPVANNSSFFVDTEIKITKRRSLGI